MSFDDDASGSPPPFGTGDEQPDESMYQSAIPTNSSDINLNDDDDDEDPFGDSKPAARTKTPTNTTNTVETYSTDNQTSEDNTAASNANDDDDDPFGEKANQSTSTASASAPAAAAVTVATPVTTPVKEEKPLYPPVSPVTPTYSTNYTTSEPSAVSKPVAKRLTSDAISITVSDPTKVGDGMSAYMTYRITIKTSLTVFKKEEFSVNRRFSDFLGLHAKLINKYLHMGIIVPMPPEKDSLGTAKVKISSKDESTPSDFIDRRRALLERYLNRLASHGKLIEDPDVRDFLETSGDLPKSKDTAALSGAGVMRALSSISNTVTKLTMKTAEQDKWFEEQHTIVVDLQAHLKHAYNQFNFVLNQRKEAGHNLKQFVVTLNHLATTEEHTSLSAALTELANLQEKLEHINSEYANREYSIVTELIKEYILLLNMVQLAFNERIKTHQQWLNAEDNLKKARERKTKLEQSPKNADKMPQAEADIRDGEAKVTKGKEDFESISLTIKEEMSAFEDARAADFIEAIGVYLKNLLEQQEKILELWEGYLPEANKISV